MNKLIRIAISVSVAGCFMACGSRGDSFQEIDLVADVEINQLADSSFFNQITCLVESDNLIYIADQKRGQLFCVDAGLNYKGTIGRKGNGPGEFNQLISFALNHDTIYAGDAAKQQILEYSTLGQYLGAVPTGSCTPSLMRFAVSGNVIYVGMGNPDQASAMVACNLGTQKQRTFGKYVDYGSFAKNMIQNSYFLFVQNDMLIALPAYEPRVEKYALSDLQLSQTIDLAAAKPVKELFELVQQLGTATDIGFKMVRDAYLHDNLLYVLYPELTPEGKVGGSFMLVFDIMKSATSCEYLFRMGQDDIAKFCVTDDYIYGFVPQSSSIKRYPLPK